VKVIMATDSAFILLRLRCNSPRLAVRETTMKYRDFLDLMIIARISSLSWRSIRPPILASLDNYCRRTTERYIYRKLNKLIL
jgi:hypothetical protein